MNFKTISVVLLATTITFTGLLSSCNKKLKDELKTQDQEIADLKSQQEATNNGLNSTNETLGFNSPFTMSLTTKNSSDSTIVVNKSYKFWFGGEYAYMQNNNDGTYNVYLYIGESPDWDRDAYADLTYNPTTKEVTNAILHLNYYDYAFSYKNIQLVQSDANSTLTFTVNQFDTSNGKFEISASGTIGAASTYAPYTGKSATVNMHYAGTLQVFQ